MGIFISVEKTVECVVIALFFAVLSLICAKKQFGALQQSGYKAKVFLSWLNLKDNMLWQRLFLLTLCLVLSSSVIALCFAFVGAYSAVCGLAAYVIFYILFAVADRKVALKCPSVATPRFNRLRVVTFTLFFAVAYIMVTLLNFADAVCGNAIFSALRYAPLCVYPLITPYIICLSNAICKIYETPHNKNYIALAHEKLKNSGVKVIGVTGSFGKTTVKNILAELLKAKYRVLATPQSFNTPMGIAKTIHENDLKDYDILIAEMGAKNVGDIAELCELFAPEYGLITGICPQHLKSFKTLENVIETKGEIISGSKNGVVIAEDCFDLFKNSDKCLRCARITDVNCGANGTCFSLELGVESVKIHTKLLGEHSAKNFALAATLASVLGVNASDISQIALCLDYIPHRLQLIKNGGINIIDDSYNANVKGAEAALGVLRLFEGRKVCVTPGIIELGVLEESENFELGKKLIGLDLVIVVGETLATPITEGYLQEGGDSEKIEKVPTLSAASLKLKEYLKDGDTVLFLNDLPDVI